MKFTSWSEAGQFFSRVVGPNKLEIPVKVWGKEVGGKVKGMGNDPPPRLPHHPMGLEILHFTQAATVKVVKHDACV